jgi:hypothetical protein
MASNPLDSLPSAASSRAASNPLDSMAAAPAPSAFTNIRTGAINFAKGFASSVDDLARGTGQLINYGLGAAHLPKIPQSALNLVQTDKPAGVAGEAGAIVGDVAPLAIPVGDAATAAGFGRIGSAAVARAAPLLAKLPAALRGPMAAQIAKSAAQGAALAGAEPASSLSGHIQNAEAGAALGGAFEGAGAALRPLAARAAEVYHTLRTGGTKALGGVLGDRAVIRMAGGADALREMLGRVVQGAKDAIAGDTPGAAAAAKSMKLQQVEDALRRTHAGKLVLEGRDNANNVARKDELARLSGLGKGGPGELQPDPLESAKATRAAHMAPMDAKLRQSTVPSPEIFSLFDRMEGRFGRNSAMRQLVARLRAQFIEDYPKTVIGDTRGATSTATWLREVRTDLHNRAAAILNGANVSATTTAAIRTFQSEITDLLDKHVPGFKDASRQYAKDSELVDQYEIAREIRQAVENGHDVGKDYEKRVTIPHIEAALRRDGKSEFPLAPGVRAKFQRIIDSIARDSVRMGGAADERESVLAREAKRVFGSPWSMRFLGGAALAPVGAYLGGREGGERGYGYGAGLGLALGFGGGAAANVLRREGSESAARAIASLPGLTGALGRDTLRRAARASAVMAAARRDVAARAGAVAAEENAKPLVVDVAVPENAPNPAHGELTPAQRRELQRLVAEQAAAGQ